MTKSLVNKGLEFEALKDDDGVDEYEAKIADIYRPKPCDYLRQMNKLVKV